MRAVMLEVPEHLLEERRRLGDDIRDEMWEGVLHMVPQPLTRHQVLAYRLAVALSGPADELGLIATYETSVFRPGAEWSDYRVPDLVYARRELVSERGIEGRAELVIEISSPGDESYQKLPFYAARECQDVLIIDRDTLDLELFVRGEPRQLGPGGPYPLESLGVEVARIEGPALEVTWQDSRTEIRPL